MKMLINLFKKRKKKNKLTKDHVIDIRKSWLTGAYTMADLARFFKTTRQNIWLIVNRKTWKKI